MCLFFVFVVFFLLFFGGGVVGRGCDGYTDLTVYSLLSLFPTASGSPGQPDTRLRLTTTFLTES